MTRRSVTAAACAIAVLLAAVATPSIGRAQTFKVEKWTIGGEGGTDYLTAEPGSETAPTTLDLGGRTVTLAPSRGHTDSDVTVDVPDAGVLFCGDLVWNAMVPNYVDAQPAQLSTAVRALRRATKTTYIPGHGAVADDAAFGRYVAMLDEIERAARAAHAKGQTATEAGAAYALPRH